MRRSATASSPYHHDHGAGDEDTARTQPGVFVGIYWNNHHHLFQAAQSVNGLILWANLHVLFWLSLMPFVTRWMADTHFAPWPVSLYGMVLLLVGCAYFILSRLLIAHHGPASALATALGRHVKARTSLALYVVAIALSFISSWIAWGLYVVVAIVWLIPDRRIERAVGPGSD